MPNLETLLAELEVTAEAYWNISRENAVFLSSLLKAMGAKRVLEVGTSNGYSTLWFAEAVQQSGGEVVTLEFDAGRAAIARPASNSSVTTSPPLCCTASANQSVE